MYLLILTVLAFMNTRKYFITYLHCGIFCLSYKMIVLNPRYDIFYSFYCI